MSVAWDIRGIQIEVVKSCQPGKVCDTVLDKNCFEPFKDEYHCVTCYKRSQFCPYGWLLKSSSNE